MNVPMLSCFPWLAVISCVSFFPPLPRWLRPIEPLRCPALQVASLQQQAAAHQPEVQRLQGVVNDRARRLDAFTKRINEVSDRCAQPGS